MALHPVPLDVMDGTGGIEALPEFDVLHRLLVGRLPAVLLPAVDPLGDAVLHVDAVGEEADLAGPLQGLPRSTRHPLSDREIKSGAKNSLNIEVK